MGPSINDQLAAHKAENPRASERYPGTGPRIDDYYSYIELIESAESPDDISKRVEAFNSRPWSPSRSCLLCASPPCAALFDDPYGVLTNEERWPKHFSADVGRESVERWLLNSFLPRTGPAREARRFLAGIWPLPVGVRSLQREVTTWELEGVYDPLMPFLPFDGEEYAALILTTAIGEATVTLYGLATHDGSVEAFTLARMCYHVDGGGLISPEMLKYVNHSLRWWSTFHGRRLEATGAPRRKEEIALECVHLKDDLGWTYVQIAEHYGWRLSPDDEGKLRRSARATGHVKVGRQLREQKNLKQ